MDADLDTLAAALSVRADDLLKNFPERVPWRPAVGIAPRICDAEMVTMSVMQALLGHWVVDSTPVECARSRETVKRSDLAGWAEYGYCASHSRYFWGLRLHLVATLHGLPIGFALTGAKADERQVLLDLLYDDPTLAASRPGQILLADKNYFGRDFEASITVRGIQLLRRARKGEPERAGGRFFKPLRQTVESIFDTLKGQLDLEQHGGRTPTGVLVHVLQRLLAMTTAIWHNDHTGQPVRRSLLAYDH